MPLAIRPNLPGLAQSLYDSVAGLPIVSPHGHCDPQWWASDAGFADPAALLITPDHYVFRMLYSQGVPLEDLGVGNGTRDPRAIFGLFARHWDRFVGTPSRLWLEHTLYDTLGVELALTPDSADAVYDQIAAKLALPEFRPRALFDRFGIEALATTDTATDPLEAHQAILSSGWAGRIIPTFRPDDVLNPARNGQMEAVEALGRMTRQDTGNYAGLLGALRLRRADFRALGGTATDHDVPELMTGWLDRARITRLHDARMAGRLNADEARQYYGHMLIEMARMSADDGLVMQIHAGSRRNTNAPLFGRFGPNIGADIPTRTDWVLGLAALLDQVGNDPGLRIILFTLDETAYARELAPMAGHWPCLRIGPPWWFHDSLNGIRRYFDQVVETAGYHNLAGFNDDTRAFLSIPARHDLWRRGTCLHLGDQVERGVLARTDAERLAPFLARDLAAETYRLSGGA
jgi:glucuronate isomerase